VQGEHFRDRSAAVAAWGALPLAVPVINGHRRIRGPYTVGGAIVRALLPAVLDRSPELLDRYDIEIRSAAPDLRDRVAARRQTLDARVPEDERILVPAPRRTLRIANGLAEFVQGCGPRRQIVVVEYAHAADPTDRELLAVLARRLDPAAMILVICAADPPPPGFRGRVVHAPPVPPAELGRDPAAQYITGDCTSDDPRLAAAYAALDPDRRARLHDARADELAALDDASFRLGAIPFHRAHGGDPCGAGAEALWTAVDHCVREGFLDAVAEFGRRGLRLVEPGSDLWWRFTHRTATALGGLGRRHEALALWDQARRVSVAPAVHAASAYGTAMLDARHLDPAGRDLNRALGWINEAIAISTILPDRRQRAFKLGFDQNARALVETRLGELGRALRLVESAIDLAERDLAPGAHPIHRMVLRANRAQLLAMLGRTKEALDDYGAAIAIDPMFPDYYLDRGNLLFRLGHLDEALADYEAAIRSSPPLPEAYYNRAELRISIGDLDGARADLDHVLELDPDYLDAYVSRAGLLAALDMAAAARADVEAGLARGPGNGHLLCVLGQLETAAGRYQEARQALDTALAAVPAPPEAWAARGDLRFTIGDREGAVADLTRAIDLEEQAPFYYNRALALRALGRYGEALDDLRRAHELDPDDREIREALTW
jgi:tetratricopeptide (TPR) repeat protein